MRLNFPRTRGCATSQTTLLAVALLTFMGAGALWLTSGRTSGKAPKHIDQTRMAETRPQVQNPAPVAANFKARALTATAKLPLAFEPNQGQADARASYVARGAGYGLFLTPNEAILALGASAKDASSAAVHMQLEGAASNPKIAATEPLPGKSNYFLGNDRSRWVRNVPTFARVQYSAVYPGIDLVYYGKQGQLEYDFAVRSGADPSQIRFRLSGVERVSLGADGSLRLKTPVREVRWNKPVVYQEVNGQRRNVAGRFQLLANHRVGFAVGQYDRSRDLIIDPVLAYATYFGGTGNEINPQVAVDANSNIYLAGTTTSATLFPIPACATPPCPQPPLRGPADVFVSKLDSFGSSVIYTTFINGSTTATGSDHSNGLAVDNAGNAYVTGMTDSTDFPVTANAFQPTPKGPVGRQHVFLTKLDSTGATLLYSTYLSGSNNDIAIAVAADNTGHAYILGWTQSVASGDFDTTSSFQQGANNATRLYFVAKFDTTQTAPTQTLNFFSYLGGGTPTTSATPADGVVCVQLPCGGIALDSTGNAYVAVGTSFTNFTATNAFQATNHGGNDAFVAKITPDGSALLYSTYLGGSTNDVANSIALDSSGNAYVIGSTDSTDFPIGTTKGIPSNPANGTDAFVAKLSNPTSGAVALTFSTYLGGSGTDLGLAIAADVNQNVYITGSTTSPNFPVPINGLPLGAAKGIDAFVAKLNTTVAYNPTATIPTSPISSSALLGGTGIDRATSIAQAPSGSVLVAGETNSANFPVQSSFLGIPPLQTALSGPSDAFLANYGPNTDLGLTVTVAPNPVAVGNAATFTYAVKNNGPDSSTGASLIIPIPLSSAGATVGAFTTTSGACAATGAAPNQTETCTLGTIAANSSATITVSLTPSAITTTSVMMSGHVASASGAVDSNVANNSGSATGVVKSFSLNTITNPAAVNAGKTASTTITLVPSDQVAGFPGPIALSCTLPSLPKALTGASCTFTPASISTIPKNTGSTTSSLKITTTAPTPTASLHGGSTFWYAMWLPLCGVALLGASSSRRRRWMTGVALLILLGTLAMLPACGKKTATTPSTGTLPGNYTITVKATSGTYSAPTQTFSLNVN